jgi:hypothetical protein
MTWTKLSDDFSDDCDELSSDAFRLHVEGLIRSNRKLLDLRLDKSKIARWVWNYEAALTAVQELLEIGWWTDEEDHYLIRHHGVYQRTREQVLRQQEVNQRNGRRGGRPPREIATPHTQETESLTDSLTEMDGSGQDWPGREEVLSGSGETQNQDSPANMHCRYCRTELAAADRDRGICQSPACQADAKAELS